MARRTWFIAASILGHLALGAGVFISGVWHLEQLDGEKPSLGAIGIMMLPEPAGGSPAPAPKVELAKKPKRVVKTLVQIEPRDPTPVKAVDDAAPSDTTGTGTGTGTGDGDGSGSGSGIGGGCLVPGGCTAAPQPPVPPIPDPPKPAVVPPTTLQALFLRGEREVHPSGATKQEMLADGRRRSVGTLKACIGESGAVTSVVVVSSTKYPAYDERLVAAVRGWRYRPYQVGNRAQAVCGMVTFIYQID